MRKYYQRRLPENPMQDYYYIQRLTGDAETVLIEYGFIDNARDAQKLQNNLENYVEGAVRAIVNYAGYNYVPPTGSGTQYYTVQKGDSLWSIANKYNVTVDDLIETNNLSSNNLQVGQVLRIPNKTTPPNENTIIYTVQRGDSLWSIASEYGVTVDIIKELNNLTSNTLQIGQQLVIPSQSGDEPGNEVLYTVESGDSLWSIANKYGVSVQLIKDLNNLTSDTLQIGQQLLIPSPDGSTPGNEIIYTVKKGDSLWTIAQQYNTTIADIKALNNLTSNVLSIGQQLLIPNTSSDSGSNSGPSGENIYIVQRGDSLWAIAQKFNVNVEDLKNANNITNNTLQIGDKLIIPSSSTGTKIYTVERGDSLWSIAAANNTTVDELRRLNNLTTDILQIGQVLRIN